MRLLISWLHSLNNAKEDIHFSGNTHTLNVPKWRNLSCKKHQDSYWMSQDIVWVANRPNATAQSIRLPNSLLVYSRITSWKDIRHAQISSILSMAEFVLRLIFITLKVSFLKEDVLASARQQFAETWFHVCIDTDEIFINLSAILMEIFSK